MPTLYLHAGTHKTGTTAIQAFARKHRRRLKRRGLLYPGYARYLLQHPRYVLSPPEGHHWFAHAVAETGKVPLSNGDADELAERWRHQALRARADVLLSAEAVYRHVLGTGSYADRRKRYLARLKETLGEFDVVTLLVYRRPDDYLRSFYQERVMRATAPLPPFSTYSASEPPGLRYHENARLFADTLGTVWALTYEDLTASNGFFGDFFSSIGVDVTDLRPVGVVRKSLTPTETRVKNFANKHIRDRDHGKAFLRWLRSGPIQRRIREAYGDTDYDLWPDHEAREAFLQSRAEDLEKLRADFFPERECLFPPLDPAETPPEVPELPGELKRLVLDYFGK